jgi:hypothetical protein
MTPPPATTSSGTAKKASGTTKKAPGTRKNTTTSTRDHQHGDLPLGGFAGILMSYGALSGSLALALRKKQSRVRPLDPMSLVLYALATEHLSRLITKDSVTLVMRAPFTRFKGPAGEGEVNEEVVGHGARHAIGELLTCPFCASQWVATGLVAGSVAAPSLTTAVISVSAAARASDYLQLLYGALRERVE